MPIVVPVGCNPAAVHPRTDEDAQHRQSGPQGTRARTERPGLVRLAAKVGARPFYRRPRCSCSNWDRVIRVGGPGDAHHQRHSPPHVCVCGRTSRRPRHESSGLRTMRGTGVVAGAGTASRSRFANRSGLLWVPSEDERVDVGTLAVSAGRRPDDDERTSCASDLDGRCRCRSRHDPAHRIGGSRRSGVLRRRSALRTVATPTDLSRTGAPDHSFDTIYEFSGDQPYNVATAAPGDRGYNGGRWRVEVVDYAADYASALAGFDANRSGDFDSATEVESAIEARAITTSDGPSFVCPVIPLPH